MKHVAFTWKEMAYVAMVTAGGKVYRIKRASENDNQFKPPHQFLIGVDKAARAAAQTAKDVADTFPDDLPDEPTSVSAEHAARYGELSQSMHFDGVDYEIRFTRKDSVVYVEGPEHDKPLPLTEMTYDFRCAVLKVIVIFYRDESRKKEDVAERFERCKKGGMKLMGKLARAEDILRTTLRGLDMSDEKNFELAHAILDFVRLDRLDAPQTEEDDA